MDKETFCAARGGADSCEVKLEDEVSEIQKT